MRELGDAQFGCDYFQRGECRSCSEIATPYVEQLSAKERLARESLTAFEPIDWLPSVANANRGFRNKAKMMVGGSVTKPTLGILDPDFQGVDLAQCPLYPASLAVSFGPLREFITRAAIEPYDVNARRGELKHVLITVSDAPGHPLMLRLVCRSREAESRIRKHLPSLHEQLPSLRVASINLLPQHMAASEGAEEILLSEDDMLPMPVNGLPLFLKPGGFFQTSTPIAAALYRQAQDWIAECKPASVLDLYCGVGGFAVHAAQTLPATATVHGVEVSSDAIACARRSAAEIGCPGLTFDAIDAGQTPDSATDDAELVIVNPPRRGIGAALCERLDHSPARWLIYSSCNVDTLAADLARMPQWRPRQARLLDMFPHTRHFETIVLLERRA